MNNSKHSLQKMAKFVSNFTLQPLAAQFSFGFETCTQINLKTSGSPSPNLPFGHVIFELHHAAQVPLGPEGLRISWQGFLP